MILRLRHYIYLQFVFKGISFTSFFFDKSLKKADY